MTRNNVIARSGPVPDTVTVKLRLSRRDAVLREWAWRHPGTAPGVLRELLRKHVGGEGAQPTTKPQPAKTPDSQAPATDALSSAERMRLAAQLIRKTSRSE